MKYRTKVQEFEVTDLAASDDQMSPGAYHVMSIEGVQVRIYPDEVVMNDGNHTSVVPRHWFEMFCEPVPVPVPDPDDEVAAEDAIEAELLVEEKRGRRGRSR